MYRLPITVKRRSLLQGKAAFTVPEVMVAIIISVFIFAAVWVLYEVAQGWWHQSEPMIETHRLATLTLSRIIDGQVDSTAGQDSIGGIVYNRRNGIAWAKDFSPITDPHVIDFALEADPDDSFPRSYSLELDNKSKLNVVRYTDNKNKSHDLVGTPGINDLQFSNPRPGVIKVTVAFEKESKQGLPNPIKARSEYSQSVFLKNR